MTPLITSTSAHTSELRRQLNEAQPLPEAELVALANARAENAKASILQANPDLDGRIKVGRPQAVSENDDDTVRMKVTLKTGEDEELADTDDAADHAPSL